ncbi:DUF262 domain-containing protein [Sulfurospirillum arcachonense]|uniref:DUF262 domain-containing protein n=1 Tax=Sulfurospirillum arcachonense TaxID=57666 RepID=UPI0004692417|nr:DUF262 domain-containing protein [Sulfurospirillum arcachonense]
MLLSPEYENKFNEASTLKAKAIVLYGRNLGTLMAESLNKLDIELNYKDEILSEFSDIKEFYDRFLKNCEKFNVKSLDEQSQVISDFLLKKIPLEWVQEDCGFNNANSLEEEEEEVVSDGYDINSIDIRPTNLTIHQVYQKHQYKEIDLNPDFQRNEVWSRQQKSLLIESILIRIPIPAFYIDARNPRKWNVIDGLQRLSTIINFIKGTFALSKSPTGKKQLEYLTELEGKKYMELDRKYQRRIEEYTLLFNMVYPGTSNKVAFNIFTRINTLGTNLSAQEIRHAMNDGTSTRLLGRLSKDEDFIKAISEKNYKSMEKRMADRALILRYLAFKLFGYENYLKNDMNDFLDKAMKKLNKINDRDENEKLKLDKITQKFNENMKKSYIIFNDKSFRKFFSLNEKKKWPISLPLFETVNCALDNYTVEEIEKYKNEIFDSFFELFKNDDFIEWISKATNNTDHVKWRFEAVNKIFKETIGH